MRKDAQENRQEIINCAKQLFAEQGVATVSMNQIAKTLGIGAGTLYRHYANKSMLCMALVYDDLTTFVADSRQYLDNNSAAPKVQFQFVLESYLHFREKNQDLLKNVDAGSETASESYFYSSDSYQDVVTVFAQVLHENLPQLALQRCQFRADMLIAMLKSDAYAYQRQVRLNDPRKLIEEITALFLGEA